MTPEQIKAVVASWEEAMLDRELLVALVAAALPPEETWPTRPRAVWIVDAVDRLTPFLDRPADLARQATWVVVRRRPAGTGALVVERDALLAGLTAFLGPLDHELACAWGLASRLFAEVVAELTLSPFAELPSPPPCAAASAGGMTNRFSA